MIEDQLREHLHRVDDLTPPPAPDFAGRAMRAADAASRQQDDVRDGVGDELRDARRRQWGKVLLGAAAAIAVGAVAVTTLPHLGENSATSGTSVAGAAAPEDARGQATGSSGEAPTKEGDGGGALPLPSSSGPVAFYDAAECASTLATVRSALPGLQQNGLPVVSAACDAHGVVVVRVSTALTPEQRSVLATRYGTRVSVADLEGRPLP